MRTDAQSAPTSMSAQSGRLRRKNKTLHIMLNNPLARNRTTMRSRFVFVVASRQALAADAAASAKISVHAGPNSQSGGCHHGLLRDWYHGPSSVVIAPIPP